MENFIRKIRAIRIDDRYTLIRRLGQGGFGVVYEAQDHENDQHVALKLENAKEVEESLIDYEKSYYEDFIGEPGFAQIYSYGGCGDFRIMAMELLGPSLDDLLQFCGGQFSIKTTVMIAMQVLDRLETMHTRNWLHRDVKPDNFLLGTGAKGNVVYISDFGLVLQYETRFAQRRDNPEKEPRLVGTARFASNSGHLGLVQCPRDDLESLCYMMAFFLRGRLPWQGLDLEHDIERERAIIENKSETTPRELFHGFPLEFAEFQKTVAMLDFYTRPDYNKLRGFLRRIAEQQSFKFDDVFDWTELYYLKAVKGQQPAKRPSGKRQERGDEVVQPEAKVARRSERQKALRKVKKPAKA